MQDNGGQMQIVGDLQNVGLSEHIKSVRFMGERGFVTTFRELDPLFALDLSDHTEPTRVGYVTLPGYNSYMQPIDDTHLLTIGHNGIVEGIGSTQVLLFDISEITRPRIVGRHSFYLDSTSIAEQDHHAFGWFAPHNVLSIPLVQNRRERVDRKSTRLNSSHVVISYAVFCLKKKKNQPTPLPPPPPQELHYNLVMI